MHRSFVNGHTEDAIEARVTIYHLAPLRIAQVVLPLAAVTTIFARRSPSVVGWTFAFGLQIFAAVFLFRAIKRRRYQRVHIERGAIQIRELGVCVPRLSIRRWTYSSGLASLYCADGSYRLRARPGQELSLEAALRALLGAPSRLERRGSLTARMIALSIALAGIVATIAAVVSDTAALIVLGLPAFIIGTASFAAMSQRVIRNP